MDSTITPAPHFLTSWLFAVEVRPGLKNLITLNSLFPSFTLNNVRGQPAFKMATSSRSRELPAWFHRVSALTIFPDPEIHPHYFDEDISDLGQTDDESDYEPEAECDCGSENGCKWCAGDGEDIASPDDSTSERSYNGSDADWYYELKDLREDRKRQLRSLAKEKEGVRHHESLKIEEARAAYKALKKAERESETLSMGSLAGKSFRLYSTDYLDYCCLWEELEQCLLKYVEFYTLDTGTEIPSGKVSERRGRRTVEGHVYLSANTCCSFLPFRSPTRPSQEKRPLKSCDGKHELKFQFISDEYLRLKVGRELVFSGHHGPVPESAPEVFEFMGILRNFEKEKAERAERERRNRSPSPGETWFERSHPMGSWNLNV
jgi:hypothetical protein